MASLIWLIVWLIQGTPNLEWFGSNPGRAVLVVSPYSSKRFAGDHGGHAHRPTYNERGHSWLHEM
jgi:hypothetical protein